MIHSDKDTHTHAMVICPFPMSPHDKESSQISGIPSKSCARLVYFSILTTCWFATLPPFCVQPSNLKSVTSRIRLILQRVGPLRIDKMKLSLPIDCACLRLLSGPECARMGHPTIARIPSSLRLHHRWGRPALHRPQAFVVCGDLDTQKGTSILLGQMRAIFGLFLCWSCANGFSGPSLTTFQRHSDVSHRKQPFVTRTSLQSSSDDVATVQLLISDTGGGHRASANALRDAFDVLHPGKIKCDIVDIYTEYGPFWPYNQYPAVYKFMAKYPITWDLFYKFGCTPFGLWLNEFLLVRTYLCRYHTFHTIGHC